MKCGLFIRLWSIVTEKEGYEDNDTLKRSNSTPDKWTAAIKGEIKSTRTRRLKKMLFHPSASSPVFCPPGWIFGWRQKVSQSIIPLARPRRCCERRWHLSFPDDICKFICLPLCEAASPGWKAVKGLVNLVRTTPQSLFSPPLLWEECSSLVSCQSAVAI